MYINFKGRKELKRGDLELLCAIKQGELEYLKEELNEDDLGRFKLLELLSEVKQKTKDEHAYKRLRLSDKGKKLLVAMSFEGSVDSEAEILGDWLIKLYKNKAGGIVRNKIEVKRTIQWFKTITGIRENRLAKLFQCFLEDTYNEEDGMSVKEFMEYNPRGVLSNMLDYVCFNPTSVFDKHKTLDKSPLYNYYQDNQEYVEKVWEINNLTEK